MYWHLAEIVRIMVVQLVRFRMVHLHVPVMAASSIHRAVLSMDLLQIH